MAQVVKIPTSPSKAEHLSPQHRMPSTRSLTNSRGMRSRSVSLSVVNRGQSRENEQQAPQVLQDEATSIAAFSFWLAEMWNINDCVVILSDFLCVRPERGTEESARRGRAVKTSSIRDSFS
jgi:hypothetical protein